MGEMVCSYQLGDRDHAVQLRETLKSMDRSSMSEHLAKRFDGTCEVLELVPAFLNLLKACERPRNSRSSRDSQFRQGNIACMPFHRRFEDVTLPEQHERCGHGSAGLACCTGKEVCSSHERRLLRR